MPDIEVGTGTVSVEIVELQTPYRCSPKNHRSSDCRCTQRSAPTRRCCDATRLEGVVVRRTRLIFALDVADAKIGSKGSHCSHKRPPDYLPEGAAGHTGALLKVVVPGTAVAVA